MPTPIPHFHFLAENCPIFFIHCCDSLAPISRIFLLVVCGRVAPRCDLIPVSIHLCLVQVSGPVTAWCYHLENQQVFMLFCDIDQSPEHKPRIKSISPVPQSASDIQEHTARGFIHWSEVVRAPKTNRGLKSGISDGQVPRIHHTGLIL